MTGSRDEAEDLVQVALVSAQPRWEQIDAPIAYLRRVIVNRAKDGQRRSFRAPPLPPAPFTEIPDIDETYTAILQLSETQRAVVILHFYEDLSLVEIADVLNRPPATVRSDLRRALNQLRGAVS